MQDSVPPHTEYPERPGRWVAESQWPSPNVTPEHYYLAEQKLVKAPEEEQAIMVTGM